jgi:hypothetical protein
MVSSKILDAKEEFRNFFIELSQNTWFNTVFDCSQLQQINSNTYASKSTVWEYEIEKLIFKKINLTKHTRPSRIKSNDDALLELSIFFKGEYSVIENKIYDQIENLGVSFFIKCENFLDEENVIWSESQWHLDKHRYLDDENVKPIQTIHPIYHFEYGGAVTTEHEGFDYGHFIVLDTPRIMHPPLDIVLAIDFVVKNFYHKAEHHTLTENEVYKRYIKNAQYRLWRPYVLAFSSNFEDLNHLDIDSTFGKNIIECP